MQERTLWQGCLAEDGLRPLLLVCQQSLFAVDPFVLFLEGTMGAGKTTFTRHLLQTVGLSQATPVTSPTYTILNEYNIGQHYFAHMDFYRIDGGIELEELDALHYRKFRGFIVEWPQNVAKGLLAPTHVLRITSQLENALRPSSVPMASRTYQFSQII